MNNDLISRKWLTDAIRNRRTYLSYEDAKDVIDLINNAPTVEERPQGEWKVSGKQGGIPISDYCTNCKYEMKWYRNKYNYCPNCGAKMKKEKNNGK